MNPGEAARLYQAALEESRVLHERHADDFSDEADAICDHIDTEVNRAHAAVMEAMFGA